MTSPVSSTQSNSNTQSTTLVIVDTGPLLCFGHMRGGVRMLTERYYSRLRWAKAVFDEIAHCAEKPDLVQAAAAKRWLGKNLQHLGDPIVVSKPVDVASIHSQVQVEAARLRGRPPSQQLGRDNGESETLVIARDTNCCALINERAAARVARSIPVDVYTAVDVLVAEFNAGRIEVRQVRALYDQLRSAGLDGGTILPERFNAAFLRKWQTPAPE